MTESQALVPYFEAPPVQKAIDGVYQAPRPGRSWRSGLRTVVLLSGSVGIGTGVALGWFGLAPAAVMAVGLAAAQVLGQSYLQNRLGQDVMGGIAGGDLERALHAAEAALEESPGGAMRTLAAANLASVLMQLDRLHDGASVLDRWPPGFLHMPLSTVLWLNNRAFASLALEEEPAFAGRLLDEADQRLVRAGVRGFGGAHNFHKISSALHGTRAMERLAAKEPRQALHHLSCAAELDEGAAAPFRLVERELCRAAALQQVGRRDEAVLVAASLRDLPLTVRQRARLDALEEEAFGSREKTHEA
ncbi:MAG: hypothetical protein ACO3JL_05640 [Myxococcota bacterium]